MFWINNYMKCKTCNIEFKANKMKTQTYCSKACFWEDKRTPDIKCTGCDEMIPHRRKFCTKSCATTYNNKNRKYGYRQSNIETYIAQVLKDEGFDIVANSKELIGSELDIYIPALNKAIEVNGIFHYKPIYGNKKLEQIQNNDMKKIVECEKKGVDLLVLDVSDQNQFSEANSQVYINKILKWVA